MRPMTDSLNLPACLPFLTADLPGTGGQIKQRPEDFQVDEVPLYEACGEGTHVYFRVLKRGLPTPAVVGRIARHVGRRADEIGFAGLKDAHAVTTQWMSLEHTEPARLAGYDDGQARVLETTRHTNKLRPGHLAGNAFLIRVRGVGGGALARAEAVLDVLRRRGAPNYFGAQRFGSRGDTGELGRALIRGDLDEVVAILLGRPRPDDDPRIRAAREAFDAGDYDRAAKQWPSAYRDQRRALAAYRKRRNPKGALAAVDMRMRRLYVSAFQSALFNDVLTARLAGLDQVLLGDLAQKTDTGGVFEVTDAAAEQPRAAAFEISATGPILGYRTNLPSGEPGEIECTVLARHQSTGEDFRHAGPLKAKGTRRALRFGLRHAALAEGSDAHGPYLEVRFTAPSGCYATVALGEITKSETLAAT